MKTIHDIGRFLKLMTTKASKKADEAVKITRHNIDILGLYNCIEENYIEIGKLCYEKWKDDLTDAPDGIASNIECITSCKKQIDENKDKIGDIKGYIKCPECGHNIKDKLGIYCPRCGVLIPVDDEETKEE